MKRLKPSTVSKFFYEHTIPLHRTVLLPNKSYKKSYKEAFSKQYSEFVNLFTNLKNMNFSRLLSANDALFLFKKMTKYN